jgi:hypothetical protein
MNIDFRWTLLTEVTRLPATVKPNSYVAVLSIVSNPLSLIVHVVVRPGGKKSLSLMRVS